MLQENRELQRKLASLPAAAGKEVCERINKLSHGTLSFVIKNIKRLKTKFDMR